MGLFSGLGDLLGPAAMYAGYTLGGPAGGALMAGGLGYMGQMQTNDTNVDISNNASAFNAQQAELNRAFNAEQADINRSYQTEMSSTAYQRAVQDMQSAGLNPMLAYMQGGASTPTGSMASGSAASAASPIAAQNPVSAGINAYSGVSSAANQQVMNDQIDATTTKIKAETSKIKGDTNFESQQDILRQTAWQLQQSGVLSQERGLTEGQQRSVMAQTIENLKKDGVLKQLDIDAAKTFENWGRSFKELEPVIKLLVNILK